MFSARSVVGFAAMLMIVSLVRFGMNFAKAIDPCSWHVEVLFNSKEISFKKKNKFYIVCSVATLEN